MRHPGPASVQESSRCSASGAVSAEETGLRRSAARSWPSARPESLPRSRTPAGPALLLHRPAPQVPPLQQRRSPTCARCRLASARPASSRGRRPPHACCWPVHWRHSASSSSWSASCRSLQHLNTHIPYIRLPALSIYSCGHTLLLLRLSPASPADRYFCRYASLELLMVPIAHPKCPHKTNQVGRN